MSQGRYRPYLEYKDSGVEWLGAIPDNWKAFRLKFVSNVFPSNVDKKSHAGELPVRLCNYTDVYYNDTITEGMDFMLATASEQQVAKFTLRSGDTIITKDSETADDIAIAAYVPADMPGVVCGYHLAMVRPNVGFCGAFVKRLFDSIYAKSSFAVRANGLTRVGLSQDDLNNVEFPFPPYEEQTQIAKFLDHETAKIDRLIEKQEALIRLLKEKRQAVISHAVTKGLNPSAPLKDSGIPWLGQVPAHWKLGKLGWFAFMQEGPGLRNWQFTSSGVRVICVTNITDEGINFQKLEKFISQQEYRSTYQHFTVVHGDILISSSGNSWGKVARYDLPDLTILNTSTIRVNRLHNEPLAADYMEFLLQTDTCREQLGLAMTGSCQPNFGPTHLKEIRVPVPEKSEQRAIVDYLAKRLPKFDRPIEAAQEAVTLLQERRTALISAAVTGKIDVRHWQLSSPV